MTGLVNPIAAADTLPLAGAEERTALPCWYAVYTRAHHEGRISDQLATRGVECFLPRYESERAWKDRKVRLHLPLFPGYVFVHMDLRSRVQVLQVPGVVRFVGFQGGAVVIPDEDLARVRASLEQGIRVEPHAYLQAGRRVRVQNGPLEGIEGIIVRRKNRTRLVISFALLQRSVAVEMDEWELEAVR